MGTSNGSSKAIKRISNDFLDASNPKDNLAVIILNWHLPPITPLLLEKASFCICADGGANRLYDEVPAMLPDEPADTIRSRFLPHLIKGDLDSIRTDVLDFYSGHGVPVKDLSHDEMSTDLQKCIGYIEQHLFLGLDPSQRASVEQYERKDSAPGTQRQLETVVAVGAHGGRLDHILSNLSTLHTFRHMDILLCGDGNLTRLIPAGQALIRPLRGVEGPFCGLVPLQGAAVASTSGLRWNLNATKMEIGGLVSTSNVIEGDEVWVETDTDLIWTTELHHPPFLRQPEGGT